MSKESSGLSYKYHDQSWGIDNLLSLPKNIALGTPKASFQSPTLTASREYQTIYRDVSPKSWKSDYKVYLGHSPFLEQLGRTITWKEDSRKTNLLNRLALGIATTAVNSLAGKLFRADAFNPYAQTVQIYHPNKYIGMHEIAHADIFDKSKHPNWHALASTFCPPYTVALERQASENAVNQLLSEDQKEAAKILEPSFGGYFGGLTTFMSASFPAMWPIAPLMPLVGIAAGHIHSRLGKSKLFTSHTPWVGKLIASGFGLWG